MTSSTTSSTALYLAPSSVRRQTRAQAAELASFSLRFENRRPVLFADALRMLPPPGRASVSGAGPYLWRILPPVIDRPFDMPIPHNNKGVGSIIEKPEPGIHEKNPARPMSMLTRGLDHRTLRQMTDGRYLEVEGWYPTDEPRLQEFARRQREIQDWAEHDPARFARHCDQVEGVRRRQPQQAVGTVMRRASARIAAMRAAEAQQRETSATAARMGPPPRPQLGHTPLPAARLTQPPPRPHTPRPAAATTNETRGTKRGRDEDEDTIEGTREVKRAR